MIAPTQMQPTPQTLAQMPMSQEDAERKQEMKAAWNNKRHYVYTLAYPESMGGHVFYVGKGTGDRINAHERDTRNGKNSHKCNTIRKIWREGEQVVKIKMAFFETHQEACAYEIALIFFMDRLTNATIGGEGVVGLTKECLMKLSEAHKKSRRAQAHRQRLAESRKGIPCGLSEEQRKEKFSHPQTWTGRKHTEESRRKMSEAMKGRSIPEEQRRRMSERMKGRAISEEARAKIREKATGRHPSDETRLKLSAAKKGIKTPPRSEETRKKLSASLTGRTVSQETRQRLSEARRGKSFPKLSEAKRQAFAQKKERALLAMRSPVISSTDATWKQGLIAPSLWEMEYA